MNEEKFWVIAWLSFAGQNFPVMSSRKISRAEIDAAYSAAWLSVSLVEFGIPYAYDGRCMYNAELFSSKADAMNAFKEARKSNKNTLTRLFEEYEGEDDYA